ncbi:uncharacterized protein LOC134911381 [Pseudophryne corroboree]|uniref:uncharacterized protein LOC134911381 n=1 Tax=Pseudophryne corroboree TaxID=495146 RepID=UPI003081C3C6
MGTLTSKRQAYGSHRERDCLCCGSYSHHQGQLGGGHLRRILSSNLEQRQMVVVCDRSAAQLTETQLLLPVTGDHHYSSQSSKNTSNRRRESSPIMPDITSTTDADIQNAEKAEEPVTASSPPLREEHQAPTAEQGYWFYRHAYEEQNYMMQMHRHLTEVMEWDFAAVASEMQSLGRRVLKVDDNMRSLSDTMGTYVPRQLACQKVMLNTVSETNISLKTAVDLLEGISVQQDSLDPCNEKGCQEVTGARINYQGLDPSKGLGLPRRSNHARHDSAAMPSHQGSTSTVHNSCKWQHKGHGNTPNWPHSKKSQPSEVLGCPDATNDFDVEIKSDRSDKDPKKRHCRNILQSSEANTSNSPQYKNHKDK